MENSIFTERPEVLSLPGTQPTVTFDHWRWSEMVRLCTSTLEVSENSRVEKDGVSTYKQSKAVSEECIRLAQELLVELLKVGIQAVKNGK
jgi:hypothetical protein